MNNQTLSELIDGELSSIEMEAALDRILSDAELQKSWRNLYTLRYVISDNGIQAASSFAVGVGKALEDEPIVLAPDNLKLETRADDAVDKKVVHIDAWRSKALAYTAIAASFAAVVVFSYSPQKEGPGTPIASKTAVTSVALEQEFQSMVVQHGEFSGAAALNGLMAYAKVVNGTTSSVTP